MPGKLRQLDSRQVVRILARFGFEPVSQRGSHIKLKRIGRDGRPTGRMIIVPDHAPIQSGTLRSIYRDAAKVVPEQQLRPLFYHE